MGYYETDEYLSQAKGGISNFKIYNSSEEKGVKFIDSYNTFIIVGEKKVT